MAAGRFFALLVCLLGLGGVVAAVDPSSINGIPSCAINCIFQEIGQSDCSITNQTCICHDATLAAHVQTCVQANCTVKEMLATVNQSMTACGVPSSTQNDDIQWFRGLLFSLPTVFIIFRVANKLMKMSTFSWDDLTILIAYAILASFFPATYTAERTGGGKDIWKLTPDQITEYLIFLFTFSILYICCLSFIKASILFLYLRIFPDEKFRKILWYTQLFNLLLWISCTAASLAACEPLNFFWNGWMGEMKGKCYDLNAFAMCHGAINVALDVWMLILPVSQIYNLRMKRKEKAGIMLMFGVGIFLTAVSAYRIKALMIFATSYNITANAFQASLFSTIELCVGIFVACLPSTRQVWRVVSPKILKASHLSPRLPKSPKASCDVSQVSQATPGANEQPPAAIYDESSIAHLIEDFKRIDLNNLPDPVSDGDETAKDAEQADSGKHGIHPGQLERLPQSGMKGHESC
ncbi:CFEM domain-containing protein [Colletotrichum sublineola]|nr:CFEM domain-containing protein [Colletotrichum sublineola]